MPTSHPIHAQRVLIFVGDDYEDLELWYPKLRLIEAGVHVTEAGAVSVERCRGKKGNPGWRERCNDEK
jgi:protease I